jgi:hypothetical protein
MNRHLELLLSTAFTGALAPVHRADLQQSGLTEATITLHKIRSVPLDMILPLLGRTTWPKTLISAYVIPFPNPSGGFWDYVKLRIFSTDTTHEARGAHVDAPRGKSGYNGGKTKYLVRKAVAPHLYIPIPTMGRALERAEPLWICEGMKKALSVGQLGLPSVAIESAWSWHVKGTTTLLPDFAAVRLRDRIVEIVPDGDIATNPTIAYSMRQFATALRVVGARPRLVRLPEAA